MKRIMTRSQVLFTERIQLAMIAACTSLPNRPAAKPRSLFLSTRAKIREQALALAREEETRIFTSNQKLKHAAAYYGAPGLAKHRMRVKQAVVNSLRGHMTVRDMGTLLALKCQK